MCSRAVVLAIAGAGSGLGAAAASVPRGAHREPERHNAGQKSRRPPAGMHCCIHTYVSRNTRVELAGQNPPRSMLCAERTDGYGKISSVADEEIVVGTLYFIPVPTLGPIADENNVGLILSVK